MQMKFNKTVLAVAVAAVLGITSLTSMAATKSNENNGGVIISQSTAQAVAGCNQHVSDICIVNHSGVNVYFSVAGNANFNRPAYYQHGPLPNTLEADAWSPYYYGTLYVSVTNSNLNNTPMPNHSIIVLSPGNAKAVDQKIQYKVIG